jgi:hypothetical protein
MIVADPAADPEPAVRREIERRVVMHHEHQRMPRRRGPALRQMRVHDRLPSYRPAVEQPIRRLGVAERAELSRQTLVGSPGDRRHGAHQTTGSSGVAKLCRPELGLGPMICFIQHCHPLAPLPAAVGFMSYMRILEAVRKLKPFKINALAANELAREKPGNGFHARRQRG